MWHSCPGVRHRHELLRLLVPGLLPSVSADDLETTRAVSSHDLLNGRAPATVTSSSSTMGHPASPHSASQNRLSSSGVLRFGPALAAVLLVAPGPVRAYAHVVALSVERAPQSQSCPDAADIVSQAAALFPSTPLVTAADPQRAPDRVLVRTGPRGAGHEAVVEVSGAHEAKRRITDSDPLCRGLGPALAVALVMLFEAEPSSTVRSEDEARPAQPSPGPSRRVALAVQVGALGAEGLLGAPSGGAFLGTVVDFGAGPSLTLRGIRLWARPRVRDPGEVRVDLWAASFGPCWRFRPSSGAPRHPGRVRHL
jgi:hypothetical protein